MNSQPQRQVVTASDESAVRDFLEALATLNACATRISGLKRRTILKGLAALGPDADRQVARMLKLMDVIHRSFMRIRRKLED